MTERKSPTAVLREGPRALSDEQVRMGMLTPCRDIEATLRELVARYGPRLCVLPEGPMTIPYLK